MAIKLIASDIDGTLINEEGKAGERTRAAVHRLKDYGIEFVIATGRSFEGAYDVVKQIGMEDESMGMICVNGLQTYAVPSLDVKQKQTMTFEECVVMKELAQAYFMGIMYCFEDVIYFQMDDLSYRDYMISIGDDSKHFFNRKLDMVFIESIEEIRDIFLIQPIQKIALVQSPDYMSLVIERLRNKAPKGYHFLRVGLGWTEIMQDSIDKGTTLLEYAQEKGIDASEIMAFGDSENDLSMLSMVGHPYAMENAMPTIKEIPGIKQAPTNKEQGVAQVIEELLESIDKENKK